MREHVDPGYATTAHRAQGVTVDTAHVLTTPGMAREALYVAMTRGRHANHLYVPTDPVDPDCDGVPDPQPDPTARQVLTAILATSRRELSATETTTQAADQATSLSRLVPIRDTLAAAHDRHTWQQLGPAIGLTPEQTQQVLDSPAAGPLLAAIRHGHAAGHPMGSVLTELVRGRPLHADDPAGDQAVDLAAVLHWRLSAWLDDSPVIPADRATRVDASERLAVLDQDLALGDDHDSLPQALRAVDALIRQRLHNLTDHAVAARPGWLPPEPTRSDAADGRDTVAVLAASRGRTLPARHQTTVRSEHDRSIR